jgi:stearoyl-CoA desaturase (delta-9 desaturase)
MRRLHAVTMMGTPYAVLAFAIWALWGRGAGFLELALLAGMYALAGLGVTVGFHRHFAHRAFHTSKPVRVILAIMGTMAFQGSIFYWVAAHRKHHSRSDRAGDPHSPYLDGDRPLAHFHGLWHAHFGWLFTRQTFDEATFAADILRDSALRKLRRLDWPLVALGFAIPAGIGVVATQTWQGALSGLLWGGVIRVALQLHTTWSVNSICHVFGSRPYRTGDRSTNNLWLSLLTLGESWHNNHHAFPSSARHGLAWWQIDISGLAIRAMQLAGLARDVKLPAVGRMAEKSG